MLGGPHLGAMYYLRSCNTVMDEIGVAIVCSDVRPPPAASEFSQGPTRRRR